MDNIILDFLQAYKSLDTLCKQILSSDRGISKYIDEMARESQGRMLVADWENDYRKLKHMRWLRNRLVHEPDSFQNNLPSIEDIKWLEMFRIRIMECTDPFSVLRQLRNTKTIRKTTQQRAYWAKNFKTQEPKMQETFYNGNMSAYNAIIWILIIVIITCMVILGAVEIY